jgi:hypothetical protein
VLLARRQVGQRSLGHNVRKSIMDVNR